MNTKMDNKIPDIDQGDCDNFFSQIKQSVFETFGFPNDNQVTMIDFKNGLGLFHDVDGSNREIYNEFRGMIVDIAAKHILYKASGKFHIVVANSISINKTTGLLEIQDGTPEAEAKKKIYYLDSKKCEYKIGREGTQYHIFKIDGVVYHAH